jgi:CubicO group peptidase (beta-lactamase class C family)
MRLGFAFLFCFFSLTFTSPAQQSISLSDSPAGQKVAAYFKAFNSGDTTVMREYILHQFAAAMLHDVPMSQRLERYQQFFAMTQGLTLQKVLTLREEYIKTIVKAGDGKILAMIFEFDERMPHGIIGITIDEDTGESTVKPVKNDAELVTKTLEYVDKLASNDDFSGVVLIAKNGEPLFINAWGFADKEKNMPNSTDTKFNIGSMDKSFTAFAIHKLAAQGKLKFTDPIKTFLPEYPNAETARKVTIKHLLEMTSGIGDFFGERFMAARKENIKNLKDYLPLFADTPLEFEPGVRTRYSNGGYIVLGMIIEQITGMDYYEFIKKELFIPAGMTNTDWFERTMLPVNCAVGYTNATGTGRDSVRHRNTEFLPQKGSSAGGGYSTANDLLLYTKARQNSTVTPKSFGAQNGMGIAGGTAGVNAALEWNKRSGYVIIVLSNFDPPVAEKISRQVQMLLGI